MNSKSIFLSKTFWVQIAAVVSLAVPAVREWLDANPEQFVAALAAVNVLVRFATSGKISILGAGEPEEPGSRPGGPLPLWVLIGTAAALLGALPSCSGLSGLPLKATVFMEEGALSYSSKGGLEMEYRPGYGQMPEAYRNSPSYAVERRNAK
jgi:hypothetical protein